MHVKTFTGAPRKYTWRCTSKRLEVCIKAFTGVPISFQKVRGVHQNKKKHRGAYQNVTGADQNVTGAAQVFS